MLYLIYGTDASKRHESRNAFFKKSGVLSDEVISKSANEVSVAELDQLAGGASLFAERLFVSFEYPFLNEEFSQALVERIPELVASENSIFVTERELPKEIVKAFEKGGAEVIICDEPKSAKKQAFNIFSITNAFSARDKKGTWLLYREAIACDEAPEAICGILFWSVKNMITKKYFSKWKESELAQASRELVRITHEAHNGMFDMEEELERFILKIV